MHRANKEILVIVANEFADGTEPGRNGQRWAAEVMRMRAQADLHLMSVKNKDGSSQLVLVAEPAVKIERTSDRQFTCTVQGWNEFNPITCAAKFHSQDDVQMWMLDTDYDGTQFLAHRSHLPRRLRKQENRSTLEKILGRDADPERLNATSGWTSHPFPKPGNGEIAVRIVTAGGGMVSWSGTTPKAP